MSDKGLIVKICGTAWYNESRDKRELSVYRELGYDVCVIAKGNNDDRGREDCVDGYKVYRFTTKPFGEKCPHFINKIVSVFAWAKYVRKLNPIIISGHDLLPGLLISWLSTFGMKRKPKLIYDAHEFELGRNGVRRNKMTLIMIAWLEKFLMNKCVFSIMVNDSIADEVQRIYKLKERPLVIRSVPNYWNIDPDVCKEKRKELLSMFKHGGDKYISYLIMYHGAVIRNRGIEIAIHSIANVKNAGLIILGNGDKEYIDTLKSIVDQKSLSDRVLFHSAVSIEELWKYAGSADISVAPIEVVTKNQLFSLPNKFFESIQAMTPVITSDVPEMKKIITEYKIGRTFVSGDCRSLGEQIRNTLEDPATMMEYKKNISRAKKDLCWEREKKVLIDAMRKYIER